VLVGGVFGLSLANAVFVDEMTMDNTDAIEEKIDRLREELSELKQLLDQTRKQ
jgi:voltage-gated sodium channel